MITSEAALGISAYSDLDRADDPAEYIRRLDQRGSSPTWQAIKRWIATMLAVSSGDWVLDVGCGAGDDVRALAARVGSRGRVIGIDRSTAMIAEASKRAAAERQSMGFCVGDGGDLPFAAASFDCCRCERVLQHVDAPDQVVREMVRITRPKGRVAVVEPDYGTARIQGADPGMTRRLIAHRVAHFRSGTIGRQLPALFKTSGLVDQTVSLVTIEQAELSPAYLDWLRESYVTSGAHAGVISAAEGDQWLADLVQAGQRGQFRHGVTIFLVSARKL